MKQKQYSLPSTKIRKRIDINILKEFEKYTLRYYQENFSSSLSYHLIEHTQLVVNVASKISDFEGLGKRNTDIVIVAACYGEMTAQAAIDNNPETVWLIDWYDASLKQPHFIEVDMGEVLDVKGLDYLPQQRPYGRIAVYDFELSVDGKNWET